MTVIRLCRHLAVLALLSCLLGNVIARGNVPVGEIRAETLPLEARQTITEIRHGGPYPYAKDGAIFGNYEGLLPKKRRGYYHEFTVRTPRVHGRGPRRIIVGDPPAVSDEYYYTDDHYATFRRIRQ